MVQREEGSDGSGTPFEAKFSVNGERPLEALSAKGRRIRVPHKKQDRVRDEAARHFMFTSDADQHNGASQEPVKEQNIQITIRLKKNVRSCDTRNPNCGLPRCAAMRVPQASYSRFATSVIRANTSTTTSPTVTVSLSTMSILVRLTFSA